MALAKRYFEFVEGTSSKFWEIWSEGNEVFTRYGRIGTDGQTTVKDQGSSDGAKKLYDKLVKEKTGKGYEEKAGAAGGDEEEDEEEQEDEEPTQKVAPKAAKGGASGTLAAVASAKGKDLAAALEKHFDFLTETPSCKKILKDLCATAKAARVNGGALTVTFHSKEYDGDYDLECGAPDKSAGVTKSEKRIYSVHGSMSMDTADVGISLGGGGFETSFLEESDPELYEKLEEKGTMVEEVIQDNQDWILANPLKKDKNGEPTLHYFSHEGGGLGEPYPNGLCGVWLRVIAQSILGHDAVDRGTRAADTDGDDEDEEQESDDDEGGSEGARRFEFSEGSSSKFWEIRVEGSSHTVRYGKIGTDGQTKTKEFDSAADARKDADKLIAEKTKKGYEET